MCDIRRQHDFSVICTVGYLLSSNDWRCKDESRSLHQPESQHSMTYMWIDCSRNRFRILDKFPGNAGIENTADGWVYAEARKI